MKKIKYLIVGMLLFVALMVVAFPVQANDDLSFILDFRYDEVTQIYRNVFLFSDLGIDTIDTDTWGNVAAYMDEQFYIANDYGFGIDSEGFATFLFGYDNGTWKRAYRIESNGVLQDSENNIVGGESYNLVYAISQEDCDHVFCYTNENSVTVQTDICVYCKAENPQLYFSIQELDGTIVKIPYYENDYPWSYIDGQYDEITISNDFVYWKGNHLRLCGTMVSSWDIPKAFDQFEVVTLKYISYTVNSMRNVCVEGSTWKSLANGRYSKFNNFILDNSNSGYVVQKQDGTYVHADDLLIQGEAFIANEALLSFNLDRPTLMGGLTFKVPSSYTWQDIIDSRHFDVFNITGGVVTYIYGCVEYPILSVQTGDNVSKDSLAASSGTTMEYVIASSSPLGVHTGNVSFTETKAPTCIASGSVKYHCDACGEYYYGSIPASDKYCIWQLTSSSQVNCEEEGEALYICSECGNTKTEIIASSSHDYIETKRIEPSCTEKGSVTDTCSKCGAEQFVILNQLGHAWIDATCLNPQICSMCAAEGENPLGHNLFAGICIRKGCNYNETLFDSGISFGDPFENIKNEVDSFFGNIGDDISSFFNGIGNKVGQAFDSLVSLIFGALFLVLIIKAVPPLINFFSSLVGKNKRR